MRKFNYVATALGSSTVDCSAVGKFCGEKLNLILGKGNRLEIWEMDQSLRQFLDIQVYGRVALLVLFRPHGEKTDLLFVATKSDKYFLLQWDTITSKLITRARGQVPDADRPRVKHPMCIIDPSCSLVALHLFRKYLEVIPCVQGQLKELHSMKLEHDAVDLKFLYGFTKPTIALLYKSNSDKDLKTSYQLETLEIAIDDGSCTSPAVPWSFKLNNKAKLLVPLPEPPSGGLVIGNKSILYLNDSVSEILEIDNDTMKFHARLEGDDFRFLLGDKNGRLYLLLVNIGIGKCELKIEVLGETSILPSTISSIGKEVVFIGSRSGDSQLMKLNTLPNENGSFLESLESYDNIGPILDLCVVEESELERQGKSTLITCSGFEKNASLRILRYGYGIEKMASVQLEVITGLWSLRSSYLFDTFLVVSFLNQTWVFAMTPEEDLEETEIEGFSSGVQTYHCHDAAYEQLIQITSTAVRLICSNSRKLLDVWETPDFSINVATANTMQVLVAGEHNLVYLEIGKGVLRMTKHEKKYIVSCLDITPLDKDHEYGKLAAVGMWNDTSVNTLSPCIIILSVPSFQCLINVPLGETLPRSILLCAFEGIPYLLCGAGDGLLLKFLLDKQNGLLTERTQLSLGSQPVSLHAFSSKAATLVIAKSSKPNIIYINKRKLICSSLDLREVTFICSFNSASFPNSLAMAEDGELNFYTVHYPELLIETIPLKEQAQKICYQSYSRTCVVCCSRYNKPKNEYIGSLRLLNVETMRFISNYPLHQYEFSLCLISCSFSDDNNAYYCVGTGYKDQNGDILDKGRILVLLVEDGKLKLVAEKEISSNIPSLNAFQGELLASVLDKINLYKWMLYRDGTCGLRLRSVCGGLFTCPYLESGDKTVALGGHDVTLALLIREDKKGSLKPLGCLQANSCTAIKTLDNDTYLASDCASNLFTVCTNHEGAMENKGGCLQVVGRYHLDDIVKRLEHGSLLMGMPGSGQFPTCIYGTSNGSLGVVASLPHDMYCLLEKLQTILRDVVTSTGGLSNQEWRSCWSELEVKMEDAENFLDGDLIESFLDLTPSEMESVSSAMVVPVKELEKTVQDLKRMR